MNKSAFQLWIEDLAATLLSILKIVLMSKWNIKIPKTRQGKECMILGNGPSLKPFLAESRDFLNGKTLFGVNFFARTDLYEDLKPSYYVVASPEYFVGETRESWTKDRMETIQAIADKTSWPMYFVVPALARKNQVWQKIIATNSNVRIQYFNNTPIEGFENFRHFCFGNNLGMPRPHNVLIPSIWLAINAQFEKIYLTGTDHSWSKELFVTEDNEVLLSQKHFYDKQTEKDQLDKNKSTPQPMYKGGSQEKRKLHEVLMKWVHSFEAYWVLKSYANSRDIQIFNLVKDSYIDAFPKIDPTDAGK